MTTHLAGIVEHLRQGRYVEGLQATKAGVRADPMDLSLRRLMFSLFAVGGDWSRCRDQAEALGALGDGDSDWITVHGILSSCEMRERFWAGGDPVGILGNPDAEDRLSIEMASKAAGMTDPTARYALLAGLRQKSGNLAFGPGRIDGSPFDSLYLLDDRIPGCLEVAMDGAYRWLWLGSVVSMRFAVRPGNLVDMLWIPSQVRLEDGSRHDLTVFGTLPGTAACGDGAAMLCREGCWLDAPDDLAIGAGPVAVGVDEGAIPLHGVKSIEFAEVVEPGPEPAE
jgi:protein involved in temperature-dependent protein secretion